jgi:serine/threonine protein kinase
LVHRDIKPENLFVVSRPDGTTIVKILDFGISKRLDIGRRALTQPDGSVGSPFYMAPEQMQSASDIDARADIWSLGVVLFELLTGKVPFPGKSVPEICTRVLTERAPSASSFRRDIPRGVDAVIARCLSKLPERRFADVGELAEALARFGPDGDALFVERLQRTLLARSPTRPRRRAPNGWRRLRAVGIALFCLGLGLGVALVRTLSRAENRSADVNPLEPSVRVEPPNALLLTFRRSDGVAVREQEVRPIATKQVAESDLQRAGVEFPPKYSPSTQETSSTEYMPEAASVDSLPESRAVRPSSSEKTAATPYDDQED